MQRQALFTNPMPEGCERYDSSPGTESANRASVFAVPGTEPANPSGISYGVSDPCIYVRENNEGCNAPKAKGTDYCIGHLKRLMKEQDALIEQAVEQEA